MTIRYLLIAARDAEFGRSIAQRLAHDQGFQLAALGRCLHLLTNRPVQGGTSGPTVVGDLFQGARPIAPSAGVEFDRDIAPEEMAGRYWGRYVAIWCDDANRFRLLRDPSGALPCYTAQTDGVRAVGSDLDLLRRAVSRQLPIDWEEFARILGAADLRSPRTALSGVREIPPGSLATATDSGLSEQSLWNPWRYLGTRDDVSFADHARHLRTAVDTVIAAHGKVHPHILATISGGLDSSIVALSASARVQSMSCLTMATVDPSGDERRYARLVAKTADTNCHEVIFDARAVDLTTSQAGHLPRPVGRPFFQAVSEAIATHVAHRPSTTVLNGTGGDNVFCFLRSATPIIDALRASRMRAALRAVGNIAALTNASYLAVARSTLRRMLSPRVYEWPGDHRFLTPQCRHSAASFCHPWLENLSGARPGHIAQIVMLLRVQNYLEPWLPNAAFDIVNPLLAQPVVETCLAIPSWHWCEGGRDRAVARLAFADRLPPAIIRRSWKGGPDAFIARLADHNRAFIVERLCSGHLRDRKLVDCDAVRQALADPRPLNASVALRLLALTDAEAWVDAHRG